MSFEEKKYHIDNEPASANDIIDAARELDSDNVQLIVQEQEDEKFKIIEL